MEIKNGKKTKIRPKCVTENGDFYSEIELHGQNAGYGQTGILYDEGRKVNEITWIK